MLYNEHIITSTGRAEGGDFMSIKHVPTGIVRICHPPLGTGKIRYDKKQKMLLEIEKEISEMGLDQYIWNKK